VLNDDVLIDNIETNIKNIADNEARPEGSPEIKFSVLAPADMVSYNKDPSKMRSLSEKEGYAKYFKVVAKMVGGSEANYMIGEMVTPEDTGRVLLILELFLELLPR
jgi:hypothetical protein